MSVVLPSLTSFDPETSSEGTLDPLGLYLIADQLATRLVPAVRERMQRIRFLTAMAGNLPGYEEATRALYAGDLEKLVSLMAGWPAAEFLCCG